MDKKIVVCGCTDSGYDVVNHLLINGIKITHIVSLTPEQAKNSKVSGYKSFESLAQKFNTKISYPKEYSMNNESDSLFFENEKFDLLIVCGWQRLIPENILKSFKIGGIGFHGSSEFLPKGRGRSPVNWSIIEGKDRFILHAFLMTPGVDDGDILEHEIFDITQWDTCKTIYYKISITQKQILERLIPKLLSNNFERHSQIGEPTFYPKRTPDDGLIDWSKPMIEIYNLIRAVTRPYPGAFSFNDDQRINIWNSQPFDTKIQYESLSGTIVEKFSNDDFLVKCKEGLLLVTDYDGAIAVGDLLKSSV